MRTSAAVLAAGVVVTLGAIPAHAAAPEPSPTAGLNYVSLGDSYAAGFGILPSTGVPVPGCLQAEQNYPHQVAALLGMTLTDVTCTGAVTGNITGPQTTESYFGGGTANPQIGALSADTDVVTVSIGGNDAGFSLIAEYCIAESRDVGPLLFAPSYANCEAYFAANPAPSIPNLVAPALATTYAAIRQAAPNAQIIVVGYPSILPNPENEPADGCFTPLFNDYQNPQPPFPVNAVPFTDTDVPFIRSIETQLNDAIAAAAAAAGFTYIDNQTPTVGNSVCPQDADAFINGLTWQESFPPVVNGGLHPNVAGVSFLTGRVVEAIRAAFPPVVPTPSPTPAPASSTPRPQLANSGSDTATTGVVGAVAVASVIAGLALGRLGRLRRAGQDR